MPRHLPFLFFIIFDSVFITEGELVSLIFGFVIVNKNRTVSILVVVYSALVVNINVYRENSFRNVNTVEYKLSVIVESFLR